MSEPIRLGIIGTGLAIERLHWPALRQLGSHWQVVGFANHSRPKAEAFAASAGLSMAAYSADYHQLLARADIDAVLIALPIPLNLVATEAALAAGKHVLCEKPTGANQTEANRFHALPGRFPNQRLLIGENFFYRDDLRLARSLIDDGAIGRVHCISWRRAEQLIPRAGQYSGTAWRIQPTYVGGPHLDAGVHHIAQLRLLGGEVRRLHAVTQDANPTMGGPSDLTLSLEFASGAIGTYTAIYSAIPVPPESNECRLYGTDGTLSIIPHQVTLSRADGSVMITRSTTSDGGYYNELINFADAIRHNEPILGTAEQSVRTMAIVLRALESAQSGQALAIDQSSFASPPGVPLWRPRGAVGLFDGLPTTLTTLPG